MRRGGCGCHLQVPWRQHDDPISGPHGYFKPRNMEPIKCKGKDKKLCHMHQHHHGQGIQCNAHHKFDCLAWITYEDGSKYKGIYIRESFTLPTSDKMEVKGQGVLGCITEEIVALVKKSRVDDGVIGLGTCKSTIISDWMKSNLITNRRIGICIGQPKSRQLLLSRVDIGYVTVGVNLQEKFGVNHFGWAELANTEGFDCATYATLSYIIFDGETYYSPTTSGLPLALDTGSEITRLDEWFHDDVCVKLDAHAKEKGYTWIEIEWNFRESDRRACWIAPKGTTTSPLDNFPSITFCMKGTLDSRHLNPIQYLVVQPRNYLEWREDKLLLCSNLLSNSIEEDKEDIHGLDLGSIQANMRAFQRESILGRAQMRDYLIEVDQDNYRVRWQPDNCDF